MSEIKQVSLSSIDPNPLRQLGKYPYNTDKLDALVQSMSDKDIGMWEGVIARKNGQRYELAFGHHRIQAARKKFGKDGRVPIIVRDLTDLQMLKFMGRENGDDFNNDFLVSLNAWEGAVKYLERTAARPQKMQPIEIARALGWLEGDRASHTANACANASQLIAGGYLNIDDLRGLSIAAVRDLCGRIVSHHEQLEKMAKKTNRPAGELERAKKVTGKAGQRTARNVREGKVAPKDIRGNIDLEAHKATTKNKPSPLFAVFGKALVEQVRKVCNDDAMSEKFKEIQKALGNITEDEDIEIVDNLGFQCSHASKRFDKWASVFENPKRKPTPLKTIAGGKS